ncbi:hypothetical protein PR048_002178 [Dryococelus australis]|uniref:Uncharacterized protein n=1 Tax=Dryococelus australis TaxID=614101 RepID=A0ABQ9IJJ5_9NEOP|nr:hypothetical protein PR048_002178 [Dryococelus australis]
MAKVVLDQVFSNTAKTLTSPDIGVLNYGDSIDVPRHDLMVRLLASHHDEPGSFPGGLTPGFLHVGIVPDDAAVRRVFSGNSHFPHRCIPVLLHTHLASPSSALTTAMPFFIPAAQLINVCTRQFLYRWLERLISVPKFLVACSCVVLMEPGAIPVQNNNNKKPSRQLRRMRKCRRKYYSALSKILEQRDLRAVLLHEYRLVRKRAETHCNVACWWTVAATL